MIARSGCVLRRIPCGQQKGEKIDQHINTNRSRTVSKAHKKKRERKKVSWGYLENAEEEEEALLPRKLMMMI